MQVRAVKVSLTAGESARMAISTSWSMPKAMSWLSVRSGPVMCTPARRRPILSATSGGHTVAIACPRVRKCPGRCCSRITASYSAAIRTSVTCRTKRR